ncbi:aminoglycoside phosphotransferase family protein [Kitasatospora sp. NPDC054939]
MTAAAVAVVPPEVRTRLTVRFGPSAEAWCDGLPDLVTGLADRWGLTVRDAGGGGTARVFRCTRGEAAVWLKLTPDPEVAAQEAAALTAWAALPSVVDLLAYEPSAHALLLADVRPGTLLRRRTWRPAEVAGLLTELRSAPVPADPGRADRAESEGGSGVGVATGSGVGAGTGARGGLPTLAGRVGFLYGLTERRAPGVVPAAARDVALELAASGPRRLVHGDLHPSNVLDGPAGPVAIDPRPALGDPDFDLVDWVLDGSADRVALQGRIEELTALVPGSDPERVLAWCRALAPVVAAPRVAAGRRDAETAFLAELAGI